MTTVDTVVTEQTTIAELAEILRRRGLRLTRLQRGWGLWLAEMQGCALPKHTALGETAHQAIDKAIRECEK